ncbi:MAG: hypothetical protein KF760_00295 [Candidatus Eremiobacteraeota bacterium]|nr:hypothetical protein [Candidatus Eremiobacteraeota bacterium]MCW5870391.1 hypothetical protein [Candidatus Eremiobacteraeota bacterium]
MPPNRKPYAVLLVEDTQQESLLRQALYLKGWTRHDMRIVKSPAGAGSGKAFVLSQFPSELRELRRQLRAAVLLAVVDADQQTTGEVLAALKKSVADSGQAPVASEEPVARLVPRRNVETWLWFLQGHLVNEGEDYKNKVGEVGCWKDEAARWLAGCASSFDNAPPSLAESCAELQRVGLS